MPVATGDAFRYVTTSGTNVGESDGTLIAPDVNGTLTIVGGFGITLTADALNRKITITNTGNGSGALTSITTTNSGTYYPVFTSGGASPTSTLYYETTATPLGYNASTGTLSVQNLALNSTGTIVFNTQTISGTTGTSSMVLSNSPTLVTPTLGAATATSINGLTISSSTGTFTLTNAKTFAVQNTMTFSGTDSTSFTFPSTGGTVDILGNTFYIGTTSIANNRASANLALTGISSIALPGSVSGTSTLQPQATAGTTTFTLPTTTGTLIGSGDSATVSNTMLANSSFNIGTTSITLGRASANLALTGISSVAFPGSTSGTATVQATATAGTPTLSLPITTGTLVGTGDTGTVSNTMLASSSVTFGSTAVSLGGSSTTLAGLTSIDGTTALTSAFATPNGTVALLGAATTVNFANTATTVSEYALATSLSIGNSATAAQTVNMFTNSTGNSFYNFATGGTTSGNIKTINIGTGGLASSTTNVTLGATTGTSSITVNGSLTASTSILLKGTGGIGYATAGGYGGSVTQTGSRAGAVTASYITGAITLFAAAPSVGTYVTFTVTNTTVAATDTIIINFKSSTNIYIGFVSAVAASSFNITFTSVSGIATDTPVINFAVIKGSAN